MSKIGMPAFTLKKQHNFDHFEVHIFAKTHVFLMLKNRGGFSVHVLTTACASAPQDNKKNRMCKFQMSKPHEQKPESCVGAHSAGESKTYNLGTHVHVGSFMITVTL